MLEHVAIRDAKVIGVRRGEILKMTADLVNKLKSNFRIGRPPARVNLVTSIRET